MVELVREFIQVYGPVMGPLLLVLFVGLVFVLRLVLRLIDRFTGLIYLLVDKKYVSNEELIRYGAVDDPRAGRSAALKGVIPG